jgi:hypothetical protein
VYICKYLRREAEDTIVEEYAQVDISVSRVVEKNFKLFLSSGFANFCYLVVLLSQSTYRSLAVSVMSLKGSKVWVDHVTRLRAGTPKFESRQGQKEILGKGASA